MTPDNSHQPPSGSAPTGNPPVRRPPATVSAGLSFDGSPPPDRDTPANSGRTAGNVDNGRTAGDGGSPIDGQRAPGNGRNAGDGAARAGDQAPRPQAPRWAGYGDRPGTTPPPGWHGAPAAVSPSVSYGRPVPAAPPASYGRPVPAAPPASYGNPGSGAASQQPPSPPKRPRPPAGRDRRRGRVLVTLLTLLVLVGLVVAAAGVQLSRPLPATRLVPARTTVTIPGTAPKLPWPASGQAALEVAGVGDLGASGDQKPVPIASVTKVMTAYLVLTDHPLAAGEDGPTLTVSAADAAAYQAEAAAGESLVRVTAGERLTERQALQALLIPSADNIARILAVWDAGSIPAFLEKMNSAATGMGMTDTRYTDPSGLTATTVSTAADQLRLAERAMDLPALAGIVAMTTATLPVAGTVTNYNALLGSDGVVGIKTGSTDQAGGCLMFAARHRVGGQMVTILGVVLGQHGAFSTILDRVMTASRRLIVAAEAAVGVHTLVTAGQVIARVYRPWQAPVALTAAREVNVLGWPGMVFQILTTAQVPGRAGAGATVGQETFTATSSGTIGTAGTGAGGTGASGNANTPVLLADPVAPPGLLHRLLRR